MPKPEITITFDLNYLSQLALKEAASLPHFKDEPELFTRFVFSDHGENWIEGISVSTKQKEN